MKAFYETRSEPYYVGYMTNYPFPLHVHEIVEMVVLMEGGCDMHLDGKAYSLEPGDAAIAFPLVPHSYDRIAPDSRGFAAFFPADMIAEFSVLFHTKLPEEPVLRGADGMEEVHLALEKLLAMQEGKPSPMRQAYLHVLLAGVLQKLTFHAVSDYSGRELGGRIVRYVYDHACENITIASTARSLGISESHLSHLFAQQFQVNFRQFVNAIRIDKASMLMRDPCLTLTQISDRCGFENNRTFRRAFVRETGSLPAAYMREIRMGWKEEGAGGSGKEMGA